MKKKSGRKSRFFEECDCPNIETIRKFRLSEHHDFPKIVIFSNTFKVKNNNGRIFDQHFEMTIITFILGGNF